MTGTGSLTADSIVYDELTLNNVHSTVTLDHGVITMKPLTASLYNGQQTGTIVVNTRTNPATYTIDSRLQGVDANQLMSSISPVNASHPNASAKSGMSIGTAMSSRASSRAASACSMRHAVKVTAVRC